MKKLNNINDKVFFTIIGAGFLCLFYILDIFALKLIFHDQNVVMFFVLVTISTSIMASVYWAEAGNKVFIRTIPGIQAMEEAIGRATEK